MEYFKIADKYYKHTNHYGENRTPPWIKLHNNLLEHYEFTKLSDQEKYHFIASMMLASRSNNKIVYDSDWVSQKLSCSKKINLEKLRNDNFIVKINELGEEIIDDSIPLAKCQQVADTNRREEKRREENKLTELTKEKQEKERNTVSKKRTIEVLEFLNEKTQAKYLPTDVNLNFIKMRLLELIKFKSIDEAVEDCKMIIIKKHKEWESDDKMHIYLRPKTLFGKTNFSQYQGEISKPKIKTINPWANCKKCGKEMNKRPDSDYCYECEEKANPPTTPKKSQENIKQLKQLLPKVLHG